MKRFSQLMPAGVPVEFDYPARSFTLLGCITPVDVRFGTGSQTQEVAESMTPGLWYEAETPFRRVVITSPVNQVVSFLVSMGRSGSSGVEIGLPTIAAVSGVNAVTGGGDVPGWVSGDFANLAASGNTNVVFDLGPSWYRYGLASVTVYPQLPSSGLNSVQVFSAPTISYSSSRRLGHAFSNTWNSSFSNLTSVNGSLQINVRPTERFLIVFGANADAVNALGSQSKVILAAYPHA